MSWEDSDPICDRLDDIRNLLRILVELTREILHEKKGNIA